MGGIRDITDQQFSAGTTIDGDRLDEAEEALRLRWDGLLKRDLETRFVPITYSFGWQPQQRLVCDNTLPTYQLTHHWPWLRARNNESQLIDTAYPDPANDRRVKGARVPGIMDAGGNPDVADKTFQWVWETSTSWTEPVILQRIALLYLVDSSRHAPGDVFYPNTFKWPATINTPFGGALSSSSVKDWSLHVMVDDWHAPEERRFGAAVISKHGSEASGHLMRLEPGAATAYSPTPDTFTDMVPAHYTVGGVLNAPEGLALDLDDLNIPIPANARVRFQVVVPGYSAPFDSPWCAPGAVTSDASAYHAVSSQCPNMTVRVLREVRP